MSDDNGTEMADYLADHPRKAGMLFAILLVLSQVGSVSANIVSTFG